MSLTLGFIIIRHVNNSISNQYWIHSYECIRKFYKENHILIIDDNSIIEHLTHPVLYNTTILKSEYYQRGELLPYYYYLHNKLFDVAVIIHDTVFINTYIDFTVDKYKMIWEFEHYWDEIELERDMLSVFNDNALYEFHNNKTIWKGCFGGMSIITYEYLKSINDTYKIQLLLNKVSTHIDRCTFERVIAVLLQIKNKQPSLLGNIHNYCPIGISFEDKEKYSHLPIIKVFAGR